MTLVRVSGDPASRREPGLQKDVGPRSGRPRIRLAVWVGLAMLCAAALVVHPRVPWSGGGSCAGALGRPDGSDGSGGCWPGPRTTGVPRGTHLTKVPAARTRGTGWQWLDADHVVSVDDDHAVLDGLDIAGGIVIRGVGVTIRNSRAAFVVTAGGAPANFCRADESPAIRAVSECTVVPGTSDDEDLASGAGRARVEDSEISYPGVPGDTGTCVMGRNLDIVRVDVHGCENGFDADSYVSIRDSYVHDLYNSSEGDPHTDGLQSGVGRQLLLDHNVIYAFSTGCTYPDGAGSCNGTAAVNIGGQRSLATVRQVVVTRNLLAGGAYTVYCPILPPSGFVVSDNTFSTVYSGTAAHRRDRHRIGEYGPQAGCDRPGVTARGNKVLDRASARTVALPFTE